MLMTFNETAEAITTGRALHVAGTEALLKKLPKGYWIGGSTEYFMAREGGLVSGDMLYVTEFPYAFHIETYGAAEIENVAADAFDNGFSIVIVPFDSAVHKEYAHSAAGYPEMFMKNICGWVAGMNLDKSGQTPVTVYGPTGAVSSDAAVALHLEVPADKTVSMNIINIFKQDEDSPVIEFEKDGFSVKYCRINGEVDMLEEYIAENFINPEYPLVGDYSGSGVNISIKSIIDGVISFYAPVFSGIKYRFAAPVEDYAAEFNAHIERLKNSSAVFSCNCILNFLYGELEGKKIDAFNGPITFGEIAYQLLNQTLVYVTVE